MYMPAKPAPTITASNDTLSSAALFFGFLEFGTILDFLYMILLSAFLKRCRGSVRRTFCRVRINAASLGGKIFRLSEGNCLIGDLSLPVYPFCRIGIQTRRFQIFVARE